MGWAAKVHRQQILARGQPDKSRAPSAAPFEIVHPPLAPVEGAHFIVCHSPQERCGIGEYGRQLDQSLCKVASVEPMTFLDTERLVAASRPGAVLLVHFEPSLAPADFAHTLRRSRARGARVVFIAHHFDARSLAHYAQGALDAVVTHRAPHESAGVRCFQIPLGCPVYTPRTREQSAGPVRLLTLGFLTRWKRIPEVTLAVLARLGARPDRDRFAVHVQTPRHFTADMGADRAEAQMRAMVSAGPIAMTFSTAFLSESALLDLVAASDMGFLYHGQHTGSVSAATKQFLSARTPLVVTESSHASDLGSWARRAPGLDISAFADAVVAHAADDAVRAEMRAAAAADYARSNMDVVATQYAELARRL